MAKIDTQTILELKRDTGAPVLRVKKVLDEVNGDIKKATKILKEEGFAKVAKRAERETSQGLIATYKHHTGKVGVLVEILCETDFVARNELFIKLGEDLAMQIASMNPKDIKDLENQDFIKDPKKKVGDLVKEVIAKTGENVRISRFTRLEIGVN